MSKLLPYETIVKAHEGDPEAVNAVLRHYAGYIRYICYQRARRIDAEPIIHKVKSLCLSAQFLFICWILKWSNNSSCLTVIKKNVVMAATFSCF